jgi:hypothetical protein
MSSVIRLGAQGWNYDAWVGPFYPTGTRSADYLTTYARAFDTVEVDSTFYATPPAKTVKGWGERVPDGFRFALKLPQEITHENRLRNSADQLALFADRARCWAAGADPHPAGPRLRCGGTSALASFFRFRAIWTSRWSSASAGGYRRIIALLAEHRVALALTDADSSAEVDVGARRTPNVGRGVRALDGSNRDWWIIRESGGSLA